MNNLELPELICMTLDCGKNLKYLDGAEREYTNYTHQGLSLPVDLNLEPSWDDSANHYTAEGEHLVQTTPTDSCLTGGNAPCIADAQVCQNRICKRLSKRGGDHARGDYLEGEIGHI